MPKFFRVQPRSQSFFSYLLYIDFEIYENLVSDEAVHAGNYVFRYIHGKISLEILTQIYSPQVDKPISNVVLLAASVSAREVLLYMSLGR